MNSTPTINNWIAGETPRILDKIHDREVNIAMYNRDISHLSKELEYLSASDVKCKISGSLGTVSKAISDSKELTDCPLIRKDITDLLNHFNTITCSPIYRLSLAMVKSNMCSKFHTDINDLRMLCTYKGPGTLWLSNDSKNEEESDYNDKTVLNKSLIKQVNEGSVVILKGAIYPREGTIPILHRSPTIEESSENRILLRIDTGEFANFNLL